MESGQETLWVNNYLRTPETVRYHFFVCSQPYNYLIVPYFKSARYYIVKALETLDATVRCKNERWDQQCS